MFVVTVTFRIHAQHVSDFRPMMIANASASVSDEPGCIQFDVSENPDDPTEIFLYEVYETRSAFDDHLKSPHFLSFDSATSDMIAAKTVKAYDRVHG